MSLKYLLNFDLHPDQDLDQPVMDSTLPDGTGVSVFALRTSRPSRPLIKAKGRVFPQFPLPDGNGTPAVVARSAPQGWLVVITRAPQRELPPSGPLFIDLSTAAERLGVDSSALGELVRRLDREGPRELRLPWKGEGSRRKHWQFSADTAELKSWWKEVCLWQTSSSGIDGARTGRPESGEAGPSTRSDGGKGGGSAPSSSSAEQTPSCSAPRQKSDSPRDSRRSRKDAIRSLRKKP